MMSQKALRFGIIGFGNIGSMHVRNLFEGKIPRAELAAICDNDPGKQAVAEKNYPGIPFFADHKALLAWGKLDAVIVATPHYLHAPIAIDAFEKGLHVLTEKPAGVRLSDVRAMNEAADKSGRVYGIMFNQRTNPLFAKAHELVHSGALGEKKRLTWIITNWYRTQSYYDSGSWRATWKGEGGGVLTNQAPHNLDILQWIFGMPKRLRGFCTEGHYHRITVEDLAIIHGEYTNGATMQFITTTGEYPGTNRLEIVGDRGKLVIEEGKLKFRQLPFSEKEARFTSKESMPHLPCDYSELLQDGPETAHCGIIENFTEAVLDGRPLLADGRESIHQAALTGGAYLSAWLDDWVTLPYDDELYNKLLQEKAEKEKAFKEYDSPDASFEHLLPRWLVKW